MKRKEIRCEICIGECVKLNFWEGMAASFLASGETPGRNFKRVRRPERYAEALQKVKWGLTLPMEVGVEYHPAIGI